MPTRLEELLELTIEEDASDLHISVGHPPVLRVGGKLIPLVKRKEVGFEESKRLAFELMTEDQKRKLINNRGVDFSYNFEGRARFRCNVYFQRESISIAMRLIPAEIPTVEELNLPPILHEFTRHSQGFVLVTGPSSQGKSTTLAALIDEINHTRAEHIITIEDPIEYVFKDDRSIINQREVGKDALNFHKALRSSFRQDPDVLMVGEMRDPETISTAVTAAETGHLVFATLHTNSASQTIHRIVDSFPSERQQQIKAQLAGSLLGIVSQRLVTRIEGGLIPACEVLISNPAISNLIREGKIHEIPGVIQTSGEQGMISLNRSLANLVRQQEISLEDALSYSLRPSELKELV